MIRNNFTKIFGRKALPMMGAKKHSAMKDYGKAKAKVKAKAKGKKTGCKTKKKK